MNNFFEILNKEDININKHYSFNDYDELFQNYISESLPKTIDTQNLIIDILERKHRIALTCFEANICQCHRKHLAEAIILNPRFKYKMKHI